MRDSRVLQILALVFSLLLPIDEAVAIQNKTVDVVSITWDGAVKTSVSVVDVQESIRTQVNPRWLRYTTFDESKSKENSIFFQIGASLEAPIKYTQPMPCEGVASNSFMGAVQRESYLRMGIEDFSKRYLVVLAPKTGCVWSGKAIMGNTKDGGSVILLQDTSSAFIIAHELGHALGLGHSNLLSCTDGASDGLWGRGCKAIEYGGTVDLMGNIDVDNPISTYHLWRLGILENSKVYQSWLNENIPLTAADMEGENRAIFIRDGDFTYWIEYRRATPRYKAGLVIYRTDPPPNSAIESVNPEDASIDEVNSVVTSDVWMMNWDDYSYQIGRTSSLGSMSLPEGQSATFHSGNISISARSTADPRVATVTVKRKMDKTPPPTPSLLPSDKWRSLDTEIVLSGKQDRDSRIAYFEIRTNNSVRKLENSQKRNWTPTYLNPLTPNPSIFVRDLPKGTYQLAIRSVDVWGNMSGWSNTQRVSIDRILPKVSSEIRISKVNSTELSWQWSGATDRESGLCATQLVERTGWIAFRSTKATSPSFTFPINSKRRLDARVFDCFSNGLLGQIEIESQRINLDGQFKSTGKWSYLGSDSLRCKGQCSLTFPTSNNLYISLASGSADVSLKAKRIARVSATNSVSVHVGENVRNVRVNGANFTISHLASMALVTSNFIPAVRSAPTLDSSLKYSEQQKLAKIGFRASDFVDDMKVIPTPRGTTLLDPTLDFCGANFPSEASRVARRKILVDRDGSTESLATEVVRYANPTAASNAMAELKAALNQCKRDLGGTSETEVFTSHTFLDTDTFLSGLLTDKNSVVIRSQIDGVTSKRQIFAVYQLYRQYLTVLYVSKNGSALDTEDIVHWGEIATRMAKRLQDISA
jgi:hypothetical protein